MKTKMLTLVTFFTLAVSLSFGQAPPKFAYCTVQRDNLFLNGRMTIVVDFGNQMRVFANNSLKDQNGSPLVFNSIVDALNYMARQGWEVVLMSCGENADPYYCHYLMKKSFDEVPEEAKREIMEN